MLVQTASRKQHAEEEEIPPSSASRAAIYRPTCWRYGEKNEPKFPATGYDIIKMDVLQAMDASANTNKFYCMELHVSNEDFNSSKYMYRIFTQHGRTDNLSTKNRGTCETRYFDSLDDAEILYEDILSQKLSDEKGYHKVELVSIAPLIGSKPRLSQATETSESRPTTTSSSLPQPVQDIVRRIFNEASDALTRTVVSKITTQGIETALGVISLDQVFRGEQVLNDVSGVLKTQPVDQKKVEVLSSEFYSLIPHVLGNKRENIVKALLNNDTVIEEKQQLLQLMKDIIKVNNIKTRNSSGSEIDRMYSALGCTISPVRADSPQYSPVALLFRGLTVKNVFSVVSPEERARFKAFCSKRSVAGNTAENNGPVRLLVHGTKPENTLGIISRGMMLPVMLAANTGGGKRTDFGYLGAGIYFGDSAAASAKYTRPAPTKPTSQSKHTSTTTNSALMLVFRVFVGQAKQLTRVCPTLQQAPTGFDSVQGLGRSTGATASDFADNEYVVYDLAQQQLEYLVEFS